MDGIRQPDPDNPRGYYEWEPIKEIQHRPLALKQARGKAVKVISMLLWALPSTYRYKVLFLERDLEEVLSSQARMLANGQEESAAPTGGRIKELSPRHLNQIRSWLADQPNFDVLETSFREAVTDPPTVARRVGGFLGGGLDLAAMIKVVEPSLYRHRVRAS